MVVIPSKTHSLRRHSHKSGLPPPLPPRRHSVAVPPLKLKSVTQSGGMDSRYYRPSSPRGRLSNPARSSTGTFDPYYESTYYARPSSPRSSGDRIAGSHHPHYTYAPSSSSGSRSSSLKYDSYSGRARRNTLGESDDRLGRPGANLTPVAAIPIRTHGMHNHHDRPSSPLARSYDTRGDTYITHGVPQRREHKRIYSVNDNNHQSKLIAEGEIIQPGRRDTGDSRAYSTTSGGRTYHQHKPLIRTTDLGDDGYSYTDPASMYRETEPAWRRPRSGSMERGSRPTSMIMDRGPRSSNRELGPPPSTRGFDKINSLARSGSQRHGRSSSIERSREAPKYDPYPDAAPARSSSTRHPATTIHQEPREHRRETFHDDYDRRDRDAENRRYNAPDRFEDRDVASRGFGIAPGSASLARDPSLDRQPIWNSQDVNRARPEDYGNQYYSSDRADALMPEPPRIPRERDVVPAYEERPREREPDRRDSNHIGSAAIPVAGAAAGAAATYAAAEHLKSRDRDQDRERETDRDRERRRERDDRDRRDRVPDERREERRERGPEERVSPVAAAYPSAQDIDRKSRERRYDEDDRDKRARKAPSSEGSGDERPRHYVDRDAARESERRKDSTAKDPALDPDEEYRRRIQQEIARSGRGRDPSDEDRDRERRRRREDREKSRERADDVRPTASQSTAVEPSHARYDDRSSSVLDKDIVQEPDSINAPTDKQPSKSVQIVAPPKEPEPKPKGILRKPTEKFPEDPEPIREGVAPHKNALKGKDIPPNARWTKIDRRLVNPEALEEAKERFEERLDCVIVLRVLTKQEIQKLADRTKEIREAREDEYDRREKRDRERRSHRSHRDDEDRDRRYESYDNYSDEDDVRRDRDRDRDRDRPRMIEAPSVEKHKSKYAQRSNRKDGESGLSSKDRRGQNMEPPTSDDWNGKNVPGEQIDKSGGQRGDHQHASSSDGKAEKMSEKRQGKLKERLNRALDWL